MKVHQVIVSAAVILLSSTVPCTFAQEENNPSIAAAIEERAGGPTDAVQQSAPVPAPQQASAKGLRGYHKPYWGKPSWNYGYKPYWNDYYKKPYWNDYYWNKPYWGKPYWKPSWGYRGGRGADRGDKSLWRSPPEYDPEEYEEDFEPSSSSIDNGPPEGDGPPNVGPSEGFDEDGPEGEFEFGPDDEEDEYFEDEEEEFGRPPE